MLPAIPTPIPMPFAQNGERREIPVTNTTPGSADASWATGFPPVTRINKQAGGKPPYGLDFQGLFHTICEHLFFAQSGNTVPWVGASDGQPGLNYFKGAVVQGSDGATYMALKPSGPDAPDPDGGGIVGPVDPVGDESGHWINLNLLYGGMPNSDAWITASGEWVAPVAGWYEVRIINGGGGGSVCLGTQGSYYATAGQRGGEATKLVYLTAGKKVPVVVGAKGVAGSVGGTPSTAGSGSSFGSLTTDPDVNYKPVSGNVMAWLAGHPTVDFNSLTSGWGNYYANATGPGGGPGTYAPLSISTPGYQYNANCEGRYFGAPGGAYVAKTGFGCAGDGAPGAICVRWHDPAKANGPLPEPALLSARSMPSRAAAPATVNLYDPETGQGSVWREEDAEAKLAEGLITEAAWLEICAAKAAEEYAAWLADPDTMAERFTMLRAARDAKLTGTDYLVAPDYPLTDDARAEVTAYRQALRDLPAQEGAPWDGGSEGTPWPEMPVVSKAQE